MNLSSPFIHRPVGTTLLVFAIALAGSVAFKFLPVAALPQIDFPTISVQAQLPGASAEIMASSVATPLEKQLGHIAGVTEMTSSSYLGSTSITLVFDLNRDINGAARDVQASINAARSYLPSNLPANPTYRKVNPADAPIMILALTSEMYDQGHLYDAASTVIQQRLSQIEGVGQVSVGGSSLPAVRVDVDPARLSSDGLGMPDVAKVLNSQNSNLAKGNFADELRTYSITANDQLKEADDYRKLIVSYHNGAAVKLEDLAQVKQSVQNIRSSGYMNGKPSVLLIIFRSPGANIIDTVDRIRAALPQLSASIPQGIRTTVVLDRTTTIRASVTDVERTLMVSVLLVVLVVFFFLRDWRATLIPSIVVPVSLVGTFGVMYLLNYSLDNLSLMALTISTGFVVDDAIVVIENITRNIEKGMSAMEASLKGAKEIGFTVLSISISLVAVFIPILLMGGIVGRLFREFAVTLSISILMSLVVSLTATPMMCSRLLKKESDRQHGRLYEMSERFFNGMLSFYERTLSGVLKRPGLTLVVLFMTIAANVVLLKIIPKGFFPEQDNGTVFGGILGDQDLSFQKMNQLTQKFVGMIKDDPAIEHVMAFTGGNGATNSGFIYLGLKNLEERKISSSDLITRLRPKLNSIAGANVFLQAGQDVRIGGRHSNAQYQYTIQSDNVDDLVQWGPRLLTEMKKLHGLTDVNSDQQNNGLRTELTYDRDTAARLGITTKLLDSTLYNNFGQSLVSTIYTPLNQYYVVMEAAPQYTLSPESLNDIYIHSPNGPVTPLAVLSKHLSSTAPLAVNHQGQFPSVTISFNLADGVALGQATDMIHAMEGKIGMPHTIQGMFSGTLEAFQNSLATEPMLILTALLAVYIVLGILYESFVHPITILSTLPSAGVGAVLVLMLFHIELSVVALIGIILLIGIVKKNAILMIDFAIAAERDEKKSPKDAIFEACLLRFRPILMTTMAALFGAIPLAFGTGIGSELRRPLGIAIIGGLLFSQVLTLYTTPVVYLSLDRLRERWSGTKKNPSSRKIPAAALASLMFLSGCSSVGPKYERPDALPASQSPTKFKEVGEWKVAEPKDSVMPGKWWEVFGDPKLNTLEDQLNANNQNIAASYASFLQARAMIKNARSQYFPTLSLGPNASTQGGSKSVNASPSSINAGAASSGSPTAGNSSVASSGNFTQYSIPLDASWAPDLWGKVADSVRQNVANAQVSAADLANERLLQQAELAADYLQLRQQDTLIDLYNSTVKTYQNSLELTQTLSKNGIDSDEAVAQAESQLETTEAQATNLEIARAQYEHAIATLIGQPASTFSILPEKTNLFVPTIPLSLPSQMLERRPDIAAAERSMAAANAQIGVGMAAYYPSLTLTGDAGVGSNSYVGLLSAPAFVWSLGATLAETLFDGGKRAAVVDQYKGAYQQSVANYRQTVLAAFQNVEDNLASTRLLSKQTGQEDKAVQSSARYLKIAQDRYQLGLDPYLNVLSAQITFLTSQQTAVTLKSQQLTTSVQLIEALGGGWTHEQLPDEKKINSDQK